MLDAILHAMLHPTVDPLLHSLFNPIFHAMLDAMANNDIISQVLINEVGTWSQFYSCSYECTAILGCHLLYDMISVARKYVDSGVTRNDRKF
jgi:hypothetical protein